MRFKTWLYRADIKSHTWHLAHYFWTLLNCSNPIKRKEDTFASSPMTWTMGICIFIISSSDMYLNDLRNAFKWHFVVSTDLSLSVYSFAFVAFLAISPVAPSTTVSSFLKMRTRRSNLKRKPTFLQVLLIVSSLNGETKDKVSWRIDVDASDFATHQCRITCLCWPRYSSKMCPQNLTCKSNSEYRFKFSLENTQGLSTCVRSLQKLWGISSHKCRSIVCWLDLHKQVNSVDNMFNRCAGLIVFTRIQYDFQTSWINDLRIRKLRSSAR